MLPLFLTAWTKTTTRTSTNRQLDETSTTRQLDNKHEQKWQGHHNSENQLQILIECG